MTKEKIAVPNNSEFPTHLKILEREPLCIVKERGGYDPEQITIINEAELDLFGSDIDAMKNSLDDFLAENCAGELENLESLRESMIGAVDGMLTDFKAESVMVIIRIKLPTIAFKVPRWHRDNSFFTRGNGKKIYKKVFTPKGAPTRFAAITDEAQFSSLENALLQNGTKREYDEISDEEYTAEDQRLRAELVTVADEFSPLTPGQSMIYEIGGEEMILHSEPDIQEPRIFMAVIVGSKEEIEEAKTNV